MTAPPDSTPAIDYAHAQRERIIDLFRTPVYALTPDRIEVQVQRHGRSNPVLVPDDSPAVRAALAAKEKITLANFHAGIDAAIRLWAGLHRV